MSVQNLSVQSSAAAIYVSTVMSPPSFVFLSQGAQGPSGPPGPAGARGMHVCIFRNMNTHTISVITVSFPNKVGCPLVLRAPKDPAVTRVRLERAVREDRRDTGASLVCRVFPDLR